LGSPIATAAPVASGSLECTYSNWRLGHSSSSSMSISGLGSLLWAS
jgi:hypothetical protein